MQFDLVSLCLRKRLEEHLNELFGVVGRERAPRERVRPGRFADVCVSVCACDPGKEQQLLLFCTI